MLKKTKLVHGWVSHHFCKPSTLAAFYRFASSQTLSNTGKHNQETTPKELPLHKANFHPRDHHISFDHDSHTYYVNGCKEGYVSVTELTDKFFEPFDGPRIAKKMINRSDFNTSPRYAKYRKFMVGDRPEHEVVSDILRSWEDNKNHQAALGSQLHRYIELDINNEAQEEEDIIPEENKERQQYHRYAKKKKAEGFVPYRTEWRLWDEQLKLAGTVDMVYKHSHTGLFHMVDWKRSKQINTFSFKFGLGPCSSLEDCNYSHYSLQLNIYKYLLEKNYGLEIEDMSIAVFHPDNEDFLEFKISNLQHIVQDMMQHRLDSLR